MGVYVIHVKRHKTPNDRRTSMKFGIEANSEEEAKSKLYAYNRKYRADWIVDRVEKKI